MPTNSEPATSAERLATRLGELACIAGDLITAGSWLAEYWSTALPLPTVDQYQPDPTGLRLQVWCTNPDEFQAAGRALARDVEGGLEVRRRTIGRAGDESTYAEAIRAFGTVTIEITGLADKVDPQDPTEAEEGAP